MGKKDKSSKRKARESDVAVDAGVLLSHKIHEDKDVADFVDDSNEPTMGEKLASLNLLEADGGSKPDVVDAHELKPPSADSVFILLKQALRAEDQALLTDCLFRKDEKVITNSLSLLTPPDVIKFLQSLVSIIQLRGAVLASALPWLKSLLLQHTSIIMSQEFSLAALNTLYQLIESRASTYNQALQLSSCLDLLYSETLDDEESEKDAIKPFIYDDTDESGDEGSEESMDTESVEDGREPPVDSDISFDEADGEVSD